MAVHVETDRPTRKTVLLVEDAPAWKSILFDYLHDAGHRVHIADTVPKLTGIIYERMPELGIDVVVADNRLEDQKELETHLLGEHGASTDVTPLLAWIKNTYPHIYIIGMSGWGEVRGADEAALEVIRTLSPDAAGVTAQIRWALALESFYNAYSAFIQKPTKKNLGILTQRAGYLKMAYMAVATKKEVRPDEKPFRRVQDAPVTTVPAHGVFKQLRVDFAVRWQLS